MKKFLACCEASKKILNIAHMAANLPVNILIIGQKGVGKTLLAQQISPETPILDAKQLENSIINSTANIKQYDELIITNLEAVLNKKEFFQNLTGIKIIATSKYMPSEIETQFAIKIDVPPLSERKEDLDELISLYLKQAKEIYDIDISIKDIDIDLSSNGVSLKKSIYKNTMLKSLNDEDMQESLEYFLLQKLKNNKDYKELLKIFEVPLLKAAKVQYKSQLQMATNLKINRITLRKKLDQYFGTN